VTNRSKDIASSPELSRVEGILDHFVFQNELSGWCVGVFYEDGKKRGKMTVVGPLTSTSPGESLRLWGKWVQNPRFGEQFEVSSYIPILPATVTGIRKYLGSGLIRGIGPEFARRIVEHFKDKTLDVIDTEPERLREVPNIGPKRLKLIREAWSSHRMIRDIMIYLQSHDMSLNMATRIFRQYRDQSIEVLRTNPYQLALDIRGIGFKSADKIAQSLGIAKDAPERIRAGILHILNESSSKNGHTFLFEEEIREEAARMLELEGDRIEEPLKELLASQRVVEEISDGKRMLFPRALHSCETGISDRLIQLCLPRSKPLRGGVGEAIRAFEKSFRFELAEKQKDAVIAAMRGGVMVITGGPGTGKTTIVRAIIHLLEKSRFEIRLTAPTGRAAKRLEETTGMDASTIHRLLKYRPREGKFHYNEFNPLPVDLLIVDEASMLDVILAYHLLKALPPRASVIFVGDVDQLPSVGPGNFLRDIILSGTVEVIRLDRIFRQARRSLIVVNAHHINHGEFPVLVPANRRPLPDFFFISKSDPEEALDALKRLIEERIPSRFRFDPIRDIQVITPMYKGLLGALNLNHELQDLLNPNPDYVIKGGLRLRVGDKVMQLRNNYDKDVYNGDVGQVVGFDREYQTVRIKFEGRVLSYEYSELEDICLAYAITVHKSQGSEYPAVVIPVMTQHFIMLQRNLLYTAVTRGKRLVCLIGTKKALAIAIKNARVSSRNSALGKWLRETRAPSNPD